MTRYDPNTDRFIVERGGRGMKRQMKLNYNGFIEHIADVLAAEDIETVQNEAWSIEVGIQLLNGYMEQLAKRAIETQDEFLVEWCKHLCIIVEAEEGEG